MEKRGELTTTQIATLILAILGFVIVLIFIRGLNSDDLTNDQVCKMSALTRATSPESAQSYIPLKCQTQKICLRDGSGKCDYSFAGEKTVKIVDLDKNSVKAGEQVAKESAEAMYNCWDMMGQGKLDLSKSLAIKYGKEPAGSICIICSRIGVNTNGRNNAVFENTKLTEYLQTHQASSSDKTYLQSFTDKSVSSYVKVSENEKESSTENFEKKVSNQIIFNGNESESAVIFMQIKPTGYSDAFSSWASVAGVVAGGSFVLSPIKSLAFAGRTVAGVLSEPVLIPVAMGAAGIGAVLIGSKVYAGRVAAEGYCGEFDNSNAKQGCSVVYVLPYDSHAINKICSYIESSP